MPLLKLATNLKWEEHRCPPLPPMQFWPLFQIIQIRVFWREDWHHQCITRQYMHTV